MKISAFFLVGASFAVPMVDAQPSTSFVNLKATTKVESSLSRPVGMIGRAMCDEAGNIYTRGLDRQPSTSRMVFQLPIQKVAPTGKVVGSFRVTDAFPGDSAALGKGSFVSSDGKVYQIAMQRNEIYVVEFGQDGAIKGKTRLEADHRLVEPWQLGVFKSGEFLLTGTTGKDNHTPFTALFASNGQLLRNIYEPEDEEARRKAELGDTTYAPSSTGNRFVSFGDVAAGSDGNVYLLRRASPTLVYVISQTGEVLRKLRIDAGNPELVAKSIKIYGGRIAIGFDGWVNTSAHQNLIKVADLQGNSIADYTVAAVGDDSLFLAGYGSEGFTFIPSLTKDKLYLVKAQLPQ